MPSRKRWKPRGPEDIGIVLGGALVATIMLAAPIVVVWWLVAGDTPPIMRIYMAVLCFALWIRIKIERGEMN